MRRVGVRFLTGHEALNKLMSDEEAIDVLTSISENCGNRPVEEQLAILKGLNSLKEGCGYEL